MFRKQQLASGAPRDAVDKRPELAAWLIAAGWLAMVGGAIFYSRHYGLPLPYADELSYVDVVTGNHAASWTWLWTPHNEHRMPLAKAIYLVVGRLVAFRFGDMSLANVALLSLASGALMLAMRRLRGHSQIGDLLIPALLLHWGHQVNLTWGFQVNFCLCTALVLLFLAAGLAESERTDFLRLVAQGLCLVMLPLCGIFGLVYATGLAAWLLTRGCARWWLRGSRQGTLEIGLATAALLGAAVGLALLPEPSAAYHSHHAGQVIQGTLNMLTTSIGPLGRGARPVSTILLVALSGWAGYLAWRAPSEGNRRSVLGAVMAVLGSSWLLALTIAYGRSGHGPDTTLQSRYGILMAPLPVCLYLALNLASRRMDQRRANLLVVALLVGLMSVNGRKGLRDGRTRQEWMNQVVQAVQRGEPARAIGERFSAQLQASPEEIQRHFEHLRLAGLPPYASTKHR